MCSHVVCGHVLSLRVAAGPAGAALTRIFYSNPYLSTDFVISKEINKRFRKNNTLVGKIIFSRKNTQKAIQKDVICLSPDTNMRDTGAVRVSGRVTCLWRNTVCSYFRRVIGLLIKGEATAAWSWAEAGKSPHSIFGIAAAPCSVLSQLPARTN